VSVRIVQNLLVWGSDHGSIVIDQSRLGVLSIVGPVPSWEGNRDSAVICSGPGEDECSATIYYTGFTRSGKFLVFAGKLCSDFTGSRTSARSQRQSIKALSENSADDNDETQNTQLCYVDEVNEADSVCMTKYQLKCPAFSKYSGSIMTEPPEHHMWSDCEPQQRHNGR
jgi:hypothetical protein